MLLSPVPSATVAAITAAAVKGHCTNCDAALGAWAAEGVEAKRAKTEYRLEAPTSPGLAPWAQEVIPGGAGFSRVAADDILQPMLLGLQPTDFET